MIERETRQTIIDGMDKDARGWYEGLDFLQKQQFWNGHQPDQERQGVLREIASAKVAQWMSGIPDEETRSRVDWMPILAAGLEALGGLGDDLSRLLPLFKTRSVLNTLKWAQALRGFRGQKEELHEEEYEKGFGARDFVREVVGQVFADIPEEDQPSRQGPSIGKRAWNAARGSARILFNSGKRAVGLALTVAGGAATKAVGISMMAHNTDKREPRRLLPGSSQRRLRPGGGSSDPTIEGEFRVKD